MQKDLIRQIQHSSVLKVLKQGVRSVEGDGQAPSEKSSTNKIRVPSGELLLAEPRAEANLVNQ